MQDHRKLIVRLAKDGINYEAVIEDYCGSHYDRVIATGYTKIEAIEELINSLHCTIAMAESDLDFVEREVYCNDMF